MQSCMPKKTTKSRHRDENLRKCRWEKCQTDSTELCCSAGVNVDGRGDYVMEPCLFSGKKYIELLFYIRTKCIFVHTTKENVSERWVNAEKFSEHFIWRTEHETIVHIIVVLSSGSMVSLIVTQKTVLSILIVETSLPFCKYKKSVRDMVKIGDSKGFFFKISSTLLGGH